ncbi:MAG: aminotransferase class III-fold pyridoxal phosphate-dependent enzyme [Rhodothermales bacterium]
MSRSAEYLERALALMPWGTQTNAKRIDPALADVMPAFIERAEGCRIQDMEGRWYIDYRSALGPIILGYRHPEVDAAVRRQMEKGVLFSMASPLELELAERMTAIVPGLEQVRFMKTGHEANAATIRLARAYTGRDAIATCGYHGHSDWFACGAGAAPAWCPRDGNGVPALLDRLVTRLAYGDVGALEALFAAQGDRLAALMLVPYDWGEHVALDFLRRARALCDRYGTVLVFDQVLTGFRLAIDGAQGYFGVVPDLTSYAKALGNGYPISAYGGRRAIMEKLNDAILTTTYAGETLSLAASCATLDIMRREPVHARLWEMGTRLMQGFDAFAMDRGFPARAYGLPPAPQFRLGDDPDREPARQTQFFRALLERGIFPSRPFLLNAAHDAAVIDQTLEAIGEALDQVFLNLP